ncbi:ABC transporter permease [Weissella kandleri]|uniref:ABC transporter permease n=1 Tax=Weissella kandleri TaxID=1616 RepID=UPI00387E4DC6
MRLVIILGACFFVIGLLILYFKKSDVSREGLHYFDLWMLFFGIAFGVVIYNSPLIHYDNYSHWAIIVKYLFTQGHLPVASDPIISFTSYPPAMALFITQFVTWLGFSEGGMLLGQFIVIWAGLYSVFAVVRDRTRATFTYVICLILALLNVFNISIRMDNLLVDFVMPVIAAVGFAAVYTYREKRGLQLLLTFLFSGELLLIKNSGAMYVVMLGAYLIYSIAHDVQGNWFKRWALGLGEAFVPLGLGYLLFFWWSQHVHTTFKAVSKHEISAQAYQHQLSSESTVTISKIGHKFLEQIFSFNSLSTKGVILINVVLIMAWIIIRLFLKKKNHLASSLVAIDISFIIYYISVFGMYIVSMPYAEAINLDGSERYLSSMVMLNMLLAGMVIVNTMDKSMFEIDIHKRGIRSYRSISTKKLYQNSGIVLTTFATILMFSEINGLKFNQALNENALPIQLAKMMPQNMHYNDNKILLVDIHPNDVQTMYAGYVGKYYFYSDNVSARENFMLSNADFKRVLNNYQYVIIPEEYATFTTMMKHAYHQTITKGIFKVTNGGLVPVTNIPE